MGTVLRPRVDAVVLLEGERYEVSTRLADMMRLKANRKGGEIVGDGVDTTEMVYLAGKREELWAHATFAAWWEAVEDIEVVSAPPLANGAASPDSSLPSPEAPA